MTMDYGIGFTWDDNLTHNKLLAAAEEAQAIARAAEEAAEKARLASEEAEKAADQARDLAQRAADTAQQANDAAQQLAQAVEEARDLAEQAGKSAADAGQTADEALSTANNAASAADAAQSTANAAQSAANAAQSTANAAQSAADAAQSTADAAQSTANTATSAATAAQSAADAAQSAANAAQTTANTATSAATAAQNTADAAAAAAAQNATDIAAVDNALGSHVADKAAGVHGAATGATANTIAMRGTGGTLNVGTPTAAAHATTKDYVDAADSAVLAVANAAADAAESAASTAVWTNITGKPSTYPPSAHKITHATGGGDAIAPADIGAALASHSTPVATASVAGHVKPGTGASVDAAGALSILYGTAAGTACQGNDSRLTNARTPTAHASTHNTGGSDAVTSLNASVITSGTIDIARLPAGALERLKIVATDAARYALTKADVQTGDTVQVTDTGIMYRVVDDSKLSTAAGYVEYTAARASAVPWSGVEDKPAGFTPKAHAATHKTSGTDALAPADIGAAAASHTTPVATASATGHVKPGTGMSVDAAGALAVSYGTAAGTACQGNDSRLTNARTPTTHAATHKTGGGDAIAPADIGAAAASHTTPVATASATGHVKPGTGMSVDAAGALAVSYGTAAGTACQGNDSRLTNARTPTAHAATHKTGGTDALAPADIGAAPASHTTPIATASATGHVKPGTGMSVDAAGALAVSYGTAAGTACQGNDSRLTNARTPTTHAATHKTGGGDAIAPADIGAAAASHTTPVATASATGHVKPGTGLSVDAAGALSVGYGTGAGTACQGNDSRLTNARTPTAHKATHAAGGSDAITPAAIGAVDKVGDTMTGELKIQTLSTTPSADRNQLRLYYGTATPAMILRNDGNNFYFLKTASGDPLGNYDTVRPLTVNMSTGICNINGNAATASTASTASACTGNAATATKWQTARTLSLTGAVTGSAPVDGSGNVSIATTLANTASAATAGKIMVRDANARAQVASPSAANDIANKAYVDTADALKLNLTGGTLSGPLTVKDADGAFQSQINTTAVFTPAAVLRNSLASAYFSPYIRFEAKRPDGSPQTTGAVIRAHADQVNPSVASGTTADSALMIHAGGVLYAGGGESANAVRNAVSGATAIPAGLAEYITAKVYDDSEYAFFSSDQQLFLISAANTIANAKGALLNTGGHFLPCQNGTQDLGASTFKWRNVYGATFQGNAATATKLATARKIGGVAFDGTADINLPGVNAAGNQNTSGKAATADKWATARTLSLTGAVTGSASVDGSGNVSIATTAGSTVPTTPKKASGVGQWRELSIDSSGAFTPSGGTWAYFALGPISISTDNGNALKSLDSYVGVLAGDSRINTNSGTYGFCWRIA